MVRQVIHAQSKKGHIQPGNVQTRQDGQTGHGCSKGHIHPGNTQTRQNGQIGHGCSINKSSHTAWKCTNKVRWSDRTFMLNQQKVAYPLEMHKQGVMVRQNIHAQSTKGHIHTGNAQTRQDGQTGHSCSINKRPHTA